MSKNGRLLHVNVLESSARDTVALCIAVQERFIDVVNTHMRIKGEPLVPPPDLDADVLLWRTMALRHRKGDLRNTRDELRATRRVADWTLEENAKVRNQKLNKVEWPEI